MTDANLVLGRVDPDWFAGGTMRLDREAALAAVGGLAAEFDLDAMTMAAGICDVANAKMAQAIRNITVERGIEPRDFSLVAFGGAGPMHAVFLAHELEIPEIIVPAFPGAFSAWGMLESELRTDLSQSMYCLLAEADRGVLADRFAQMEAACLDTLVDEGVPAGAARTEHAMDLRYVAQEYTLTIPIESAEHPLQPDFAAALSASFDDAHLARFGHSNPGAPVELVALRTSALGDLGRPEPKAAPAVENAGYPSETCEAMFGRTLHDTRVVRRDSLRPGAVLDGPAIVVEQTATTVVPPANRLAVHPLGAMIIRADRES